LDELATVVDDAAEGIQKHLLDYTHYSLAMHKDRRMAIFTATNIDGDQAQRIKRKGDSWGFDPRIPDEAQFGNDLYVGNELDRGHLVRRLDPVWGSEEAAKQAEKDTFFFTNCAPQHSSFNRRLWLGLEEYLLDNVDTRDFKGLHLYRSHL
jgi:endonuclease G